MKKLMQKLKNFINKHGVIKTFGPLVILVLALVVLPHGAWATEAATTTGEVVDETKAQLVATLVTAFAFLQAMLYPLVMMASALMDNEILLGADMESKLLEIWVEVRNWVNILFVLALVGIAIYNVMGIAGDGSNYALKSILPKIVIGLIAVNFSFLGMKILIDSVGVMTEAVYALPTQFSDWDAHKGDLEVRLCNNYEKNDHGEDGYIEEFYEVRPENAGAAGEVNGKTVEDASLLGVILCEKDSSDSDKLSGEFNSFGDSFFSQFGQHNATTSIMINMGLLNDMDNIQDMIDSESDQAAVDILADMALRSLFTIFMYIMFGFAFAALVVVFLARLVILWICLALSPFLVLFFVFPDLSNFAGGGELDLKDKFFKHLFVPLVIGIVLSIGFTLIGVLYDSGSGEWMGQLGSAKFSQLDSKSKDVSELISAVQTTDVSDFQDLLIAVAAVMIIWIGVFSAAEGTVASSITSSIKSAGESVGKFIAKTPMYMTVIPIPGVGDKGADMPLASIFQMPRMLEQARSDKSNKAARQGLESLGFRTSSLSGRKQEALDTIGSTSDRKDEARALNKYMLYEGSKDNERNLEDILGRMEGVNSDVLSAAKESDRTLVDQLSRDDNPLYTAVWGSGVTPDVSSWGQTSPGEDNVGSSSSSSTSGGGDNDSSGQSGAPGSQDITVTIKDAADSTTLSAAGVARGVAAAVKSGSADDILSAPLSSEASTAVDNLDQTALERVIGSVPITGGKVDSAALAEAVTSADPEGAPDAPTVTPALEEDDDDEEQEEAAVD